MALIGQCSGSLPASLVFCAALPGATPLPLHCPFARHRAAHIWSPRLPPPLPVALALPRCTHRKVREGRNIPSQHVWLPAKSLHRIGGHGRASGMVQKGPWQRHGWPCAAQQTRRLRRPAHHPSPLTVHPHSKPPAHPPPALPLAANLASLPAGRALGNDASGLRVIPVGFESKVANANRVSDSERHACTGGRAGKLSVGHAAAALCRAAGPRPSAAALAGLPLLGDAPG